MWAHGITALSLCTDHRPRDDLRGALDVSGAVLGAAGSIRGDYWTAAIGSDSLFYYWTQTEDIMQF